MELRKVACAVVLLAGAASAHSARAIARAEEGTRLIPHHHSDHNLELGPVIYNGWVDGPAGRVDAYGPPGLQKMLAAFFDYMRPDIDVRIVDEGRADLRTSVFAHEVARPGVVLENADVRVTAARVVHPMVEHAYAYRFDAGDRSVVISGDSTYAPALVDLARGADVLVHEILYPPGVEALLRRVPHAARLRAHLFASHTVPEDVGRVAAQAGVKTLVLTHFVPSTTRRSPPSNGPKACASTSAGGSWWGRT